MKPIHLLFLQTACRLSEQDDTNGVEPRRVQQALSIGDQQTETILEFLVEEGLVVWPAKGHILMTEVGSNLIQRLLRELVVPPPPPREGSARVLPTVEVGRR